MEDSNNEITESHRFDYRKMTDEHKKVAAEITEIIEQWGQKDLASFVKQQFELKTVPLFDISNSKFVKKAEEFGLAVNIQGYVHDRDSLGDEIKFPIVLISDDIRRLDDFIDSISK